MWLAFKKAIFMSSCWHRRADNGGTGGAEDGRTGGAGGQGMVDAQVEQEDRGWWHR